MIAVRALAAADVPAYRALMLEAYAADADAFTSTAAERRAEADAWWQARAADALGAFDDGSGAGLVGAVALDCERKTKTRHRATLVGMVVAPGHRGRGIGRRLVEAALARARERGACVVGLTVTAGNAGAIALYARCGFAAWGTEPMAIATPAGFRDKVHMALVLAPPA